MSLTWLWAHPRSRSTALERMMMERGDVISLWWPGAPIDADHFWTKPVLSVWIMALSMTIRP